MDIWEDWIVFPPDFTTGLRSRLEGASAEAALKPDEVSQPGQKDTEQYVSRFKASSFQLATTPARGEGQHNGSEDGEPMDVSSDIDGEPADDVDGEPVDDIDGVPVDDIDGVPVDDLDGVPVDSMDGEPVDNVDGGLLHDHVGVDAANEDIDGTPINNDLDGEPMNDVT